MALWTALNTLYLWIVRFNHTLILLLLLLLPASLLGQDPYFISLNRSVGLPSNSVYDIIQDRKGYIWLATNEGISRYDGFEFKTFYAPSQSSTPGSSLYEDYQGRIWYENFDGYIYYVDNETLHLLEAGKPMGYIPFGVLNNNLYLPTFEGVEIYSLETLKLIHKLPLNSNEFGNAAFNQAEYYMMVNFKLGVVNRKNELKFINYPEILLGEDFKIFSNDSATVLVSKLNTDRTAYTYANNQIIKLFELKEPDFIQHINYFGGKYWISSANGLFVYDKNGKVENNGLPYFEGNSISKIIIDRQNNYWITSTDNGLMLVPEWSTRMYKNKEHQFTKIVKREGGFYLGTKSGEILATDYKLSKFEPIFNSNKRFPVELVVFDEKQNYMFVDAKERYSRTPGNLKPLKGPAIKALAKVDEKYNAYAASGLIGLLRTNSQLKSKWDTIFKSNILTINPDLSEIKNKIRGKAVTFSEKKQQIYYATNLGLFAADTSGIEEILVNGESILAYNLCSAGAYLYILTNQKNLIRLNPDKSITKLNSFFELEESSIKRIKSINNNLYIITSTAIIELYVNDPRLPYRHINIKINPYEVQDIEVSNGDLYLIADGAIIRVNKNQNAEAKGYPYFNINKLKVNGIQADHLQANTFRHNENNIEINYSVLNFGTADEPPVFYQINKQGWEQLSNESRTLKFPALLPGDYEISFRIGNEKNGEYPTDKIKFSINKPFWITWWFILLCGVFIFSIIIFYFRRKTNSLIRKNKLATEKMNLEQELSKSILTSIKAQMNPHFFYNALNTIQSFIYADNKKSAGNYLGKFSKLTRMILEMSEKDNVFLSEEIQALSLYLELEKMRFNEEFEYSITTSENIEAEEIKFPPMIIQPYVENAIKHGLLHREGAKKLSIHFDIMDNTLIVKVDDNGIGRKQSNEMNVLRSNKHKSFSSQANQTRLEILNRGRKNKVGVQFEDKVNPMGAPAGTTVIITIPNQI